MNKPVYAIYVDTLTQWYGDTVADEIGATNPRGYNTIIFAFWTPNQDGTSHPVDIGLVWAHPERFFDLQTSKYGSTPEEIRKNLLKLYHDNGVNVLISAFGSTSFPTSYGISATACGENLAQFVIDMKLDGVDLDYEDNQAMNEGKAIPWLIEMTDAMVKKFKATGKKYIMTNAPQAPYFMDGHYKQNYVDLYKAKLSDGSMVGDHIDSYLVQFYNQASSTYSNYTTLFESSNGWSLGTSAGQIAKKGIPLSKLAIGKPVSQGDVANTGYLPVSKLASILQTARQTGKVWANMTHVGGVMGWKFRSDPEGMWVNTLKSAIETGA